MIFLPTAACQVAPALQAGFLSARRRGMVPAAALSIRKPWPASPTPLSAAGSPAAILNGEPPKPGAALL